MSAEFLELKIPITENTTKKIVALAALTGKSLTDIKDAIAADLIDEEAFDAFVSHQLHSALAELDGHREEAEEDNSVMYSVSFPRGNNSFTKAEQRASSVIDDIAGHSLSQDEDNGAPSLEEQYEIEEKALRDRPTTRQQTASELLDIPQAEFPDVGDNVDAFIDLGTEEPPRQARLSAKVAQTKAPAGRKPKKGAIISEYTGDEDVTLL